MSPETGAPEPSIYVIDDDEAVRQSLEWLISSISLPVQTFTSAEAFLQSFDPLRPGCVIADVRMPEMSGLELQKTLTARAPNIPVIIVTGHGELDMAVDAMKAGAYDFIQKPYKQQAMLETIQKAVRRSQEDFKTHGKASKNSKLLEKLTKRERQVLDGIVNGEPNKRIAGNLGISEKTVEFHRSRIMEKLEARSLAELIKKIVMVNNA
ncbi:MAG: response regulator [Rhodospirillales bacterium]